MNGSAIVDAAELGMFRPRQKFQHLAEDHVPLDKLTGTTRFESRALRTITSGETVVGVVGPRGGGKSSLIAAVCTGLPEEFIALRVPVTGADDPASVSVMAAVALSQALADIEMARHQQEAIQTARADETTAERVSGSRGGTLGGGLIPAQIHAELDSLRKAQTTNSLAVDRLSGLDRLIDILAARQRRPIFVLEDTEAAIGADEESDAEKFLAGPLHALVHEVDAACLIAIQDVFTAAHSFKQLAPSMALVELPRFGEADAAEALGAIVENRLGQHGCTSEASAILDEDAFHLLVSLYEESEGNLRSTLAVLQSATEYAADASAERVGLGHVRGAIGDWRDRLPVTPKAT